MGKVHKNIEIARISVHNLMVLEPSNSGHYSLLVNMYAEVNRRSDVAKVWSEMKDLVVQKTCPGLVELKSNRKFTFLLLLINITHLMARVTCC